MDFANELLRRYDSYYRGTKTVENRARTYILYDDVIVEGTMLSMIGAMGFRRQICPDDMEVFETWFDLGKG